MSSSSLQHLSQALGDVDSLIADHPIVTGGGKGAPKARQGAELTRGGTVLLASALEGFVEGLFDEAVDALYKSQSDSRRKEFKHERSGKMHGVSPYKIEMLFSHIGMPWVIDGISWRKFNNASVRDSLQKLTKARNKIAHGDAPKTAQLNKLKSWRNVVERFAKKLDKKVADHVENETGKRPW